jgi:hypothetical protein
MRLGLLVKLVAPVLESALALLPGRFPIARLIANQSGSAN